jgi:hypothetical protein
VDREGIKKELEMLTWETELAYIHNLGVFKVAEMRSATIANTTS